MGSHLLREGEQLFLSSPTHKLLEKLLGGPPGKLAKKKKASSTPLVGYDVVPTEAQASTLAVAMIEDWMNYAYSHSTVYLWTDAKGTPHSVDGVTGCGRLSKAFVAKSKSAQLDWCKAAFKYGVPEGLLVSLTKMDVYKWTPVHWYIWARTNPAAESIYGTLALNQMLTLTFDPIKYHATKYDDPGQDAF